MVEVILKLPDAIAHSFGETPEDIAQRILENAAIEGYRTGRLSHRQVAELLRMDYWQTERFFAGHGVPLNYTTTELEADRLTLKEVFRDK